MLKRLLIGLIFALVLAACEEDNPSVRQVATPNPASAEIVWGRPEVLISPQNAARLSLQGRLDGHSGTVYSSASNANGQRYATIGGDDRFIVWNIASGRSLIQENDADMRAAFFLPDNQHILGYDIDSQLHKWRLSDGERVNNVLGHEQRISAAALSQDGAQIALGGVDGSVQVFDTDTLARLTHFTAQEGGFTVLELHYNSAGDILYTVGANGSIRGWNTRTWERVSELEDGFPAPLRTVSSPDGRLLAVAYASQINLYDLNTGASLNNLEILRVGRVQQLLFSGDGAWLAIGSDLPGVQIYDVASGQMLVALTGHSTNFLEMAFAPDKSMILTGLDGGAAFLWDLRQILSAEIGQLTGEIQIPRASFSQLPDLMLSKLDWSPDGRYIMLADRRGPVYMLAVPSE